MKNSQKMLLSKAIKFNPPESVVKGKVSKKIPMGFLTEFQRKIKGFELSEYSSGPKFRNRDTLVAKITPCLENGKTAYVDILEDGEVAFGSSEFIVLRNTEYTDSKFIYYFARSSLFRQRAISCMEGTSGRRRVNENTLKNFEFNFPSLKDQQKIASILSTLDSKIELNNKINTELEAMAKTLYDYWFVQFDFPDENGNPYKTSGGEMIWSKELKRDIPKGWGVKKMRDLLPVITGKQDANFATKDGRYNFFTCGEEIMKCDSYEFEGKAVLIAGNGNFGIKLYEGKFNAYQRTYILIPNNEKHYTIIYLAVKDKIQSFKNSSRGSIIKFITKGDIENILIPLPKDQNLDVFTQLNTITEKIEKNLEENQKLAELRDFLLPMLMNGQIVVGE